eukprot:TRINITY_DN15161_c0_g1_i1.p1 TRINITY_DN15161_c0_g1~~TRINITY_DN15161_c0_g1_i1.p1  ORF type:complete len:139 (+),score=15.27 TRINITY_DN15161_c0_g1_i1:83-499(+)
MISEHGLVSLYRGFWSMLCCSVISRTVRYAVYQASRKKDQKDDDNSSGYDIWLYVAGLSSVLVSTPFDVVTTQIQNSVGPYNTLSITKHLWEAEGILGFFRGLVPRLLKFGILGSILYFPSSLLKKHISELFYKTDVE